MKVGTRCLLLVLLAAGIPVLVLSAYFYQLRASQIEQAKIELSTRSRLLARKIEAEIQATIQLVYVLSRMREIQSSGETAACSELFKTLDRQFSKYTGFFKIRPDGVVECVSHLPSGGQLSKLDDRDYFRAAVASKEIVVSKVRIGEISGLPILPVSFAVRDESGRVKFVLTVTLDLADNLASLVNAASNDGLTLMLIDEGGGVVARKPEGNGVVGTSIIDTPLFRSIRANGAIVHEQVDIDGVPRVWAAVLIQEHAGSKLILAAAVSTAALLAEVNNRFIQALIVLCAVALIAIAGALGVSRFGIQQPVRKIMEFVQHLRAGDVTVRIAAPYPGGEFGYLMEALNETAASLEKQFSEITDTRDQLFQAQKVQALGQLTGGIAHDLNNILTVIIGNIDIIRHAAKSDPDLEMSASLVRRAAERGANLTKGLLAYSRKQPLNPRAIDLNELVRETDHLLRRSLGEQINVMTAFGDRLDLALVDPVHLQTALINLAVNARDAMPNGGNLTIETCNADLDEEYAAKHSEVRSGSYVLLAVSDTGSGIPQEIQDKIFEPFFTTKDKSKGTGLGLSTVYGFVKQSEGHIKIYSEKGIGTTIKMYFPRAPEGAEKEVAPIADDSAPTGRETILVVEDDEMVRDNVVSQLNSLGYTAFAARTAVEALTILTERPSIDLLFTDVVLPGGMNGRRLADEARRGRPSLRVLFTSGYTENAIIHHGRVDRDIILLTKPYSKPELARMVRIALSAGPPNA